MPKIDAAQILKDADGFHGLFVFDPEHTEDHGIGHIADVHNVDDRLMYVPEGFDVRDDVAHTICEPIEQHVAEPLVRMLNAAGELARSLLAAEAEVRRMQAVVEGAWISYSDLGALALQVGDVIDEDDVRLYEQHVAALGEPLIAYRAAVAEMRNHE
jgi:hypothetical protein